MIKKALFATLALAVLSSAASAAEYYVVQERDTKKCKVVETRPTETTWVQVGRWHSRPKRKPIGNSR